MNWFYATKDKTQAGPVDEAALAELLRSGTITSQTLVWKEGMDNWLPYGSVLGLPTAPSAASEAAPYTAAPVPGGATCAECGGTFPPEQLISLAGRTVCSACKPVAVQKLQEGVVSFGETVDPEDLWQKVQAKGFECNVGTVLSRSWTLLTGNFWPCVGVTILGMLVNLAATSIPFVSVLGMFLVQPQMIAGLNYYFVKQFRGESATLNDSFAGFRFGYGRQALYMLIAAGFILGLIFVAAIPMAIAIPLLSRSFDSEGTFVGIMLLIMIPFILVTWYLFMCWIFTPLLILDKGIKVLAAMKLSRRVVHFQFWKFILFFLFFMVLGLAGFVTACLGYIVVIPLCFAMISRVYEDAFGTTPRQA